MRQKFHLLSYVFVMSLVVFALSSCTSGNNPPTKPSDVDRAENSRDDIDTLDTKRMKAKGRYDELKRVLREDINDADTFAKKAERDVLERSKSSYEELDGKYMAACRAKYGDGNRCHSIIEAVIK